MNLRIYTLFAIVLFFSCSNESKNDDFVQSHIETNKLEYAPDKRVALLNIEAIKNKDVYVLKGESNLPLAIDALKRNLALSNIQFLDSIHILPSADLNGKTKGIVTISVANLRSDHSHSAELATQATLGTPVKVYKSYENWYLVQTPDRYLSWVDSGGIELMDDAAASNWKSKEKVIFTKTFGHAFSEPRHTSTIVSDIVAGGILENLGEVKGFYKVGFPDGRIAYIEHQKAEDYKLWLEKLDPTSNSLVATSKTLIGVPYLWGGTSTKGVDCSGFTKTIYFLNGMVIPRDASQQVHTGKAIDSTRNFVDLVAGDLLFFGSKATDSTKEKVVHVGMWIGNNEFIHSSGRVQISSVDKNAPNYDAFNQDRYLRSKRILNENEGLINLTKATVFKD